MTLTTPHINQQHVRLKLFFKNPSQQQTKSAYQPTYVPSNSILEDTGCFLSIIGSADFQYQCEKRVAAN